MNKLNQKYETTIRQLDEWVKWYIENSCDSFSPSMVRLCVEEATVPITIVKGTVEDILKRNIQKLRWFFEVDESIKKESLTEILNICRELLQEKIPSLVSLEELNEILEYAAKKEIDFCERLKESLFEKIADGKLIQYYLERTMKGIPDKEIFIQLSALNYEKRVTHTHLVFDIKKLFSMDNNNTQAYKDRLVFDEAMEFEIEKIRLIRKLMEISRETFGLVIQKESDKWYIKGVAPLNELEDTYQVEIDGHSAWKLKHDSEVLFEYREGIYKLSSIGTEKNVYEKEYAKLKQIISDRKTRDNVEIVIRSIREHASHGTGMIFIEDDDILKSEIDRLSKFGKAYAIKENAVDLLSATPELLKGIAAIDGAIFCNFNLQCKAIGVIVDGLTVKKGNPGKGARYNSLTNYVKWLNIEKGNGNYMAVVMSEDGPINIEISTPNS